MLRSGLDFLRATEAAAIAASEWVGTGDKKGADKAATEAMAERLNCAGFAGVVVIGEGKKDKSAGLFSGDRVGKLKNRPGKHYELAVDPIDGTRPTVTSGPEALSVLAVAGEKKLFTTECYYMNKLAYGPHIAKHLNLTLTEPFEKTVKKVSKLTGKEISNIVVCVLDRPRHTKLIQQLRNIGVRIKLIMDCDISGAIATCLPDSGIDLLYGVGGAPEAVITACAMKCLKGGFKAQLANTDGTIKTSKVYDIENMVRGNCVFAATGITNGSLLKGVRFTSRGPVTNSVVMRSESGTVRWITAYHGN
jgi:fructose-1,6-bisphosphatase II